MNIFGKTLISILLSGSMAPNFASTPKTSSKLSVYKQDRTDNVAAAVEKYFDAFKELSFHPVNMANRQILLDRGIDLAAKINALYKKTDSRKLDELAY